MTRWCTACWTYPRTYMPGKLGQTDELDTLTSATPRAAEILIRLDRGRTGAHGDPSLDRPLHPYAEDLRAALGRPGRPGHTAVEFA